MINGALTRLFLDIKRDTTTDGKLSNCVVFEKVEMLCYKLDTTLMSVGISNMFVLSSNA